MISAVPQPMITVQCDPPADLANGETPPPTEWVPEVEDLVLTSCVLDQDRKKRKERRKAMRNWPKPPYHHLCQFLYFWNPSSFTSAAHSGALSGACWLFHENLQHLEMAPSMCGWRCSRPAAQEGVAVGNTPWSKGFMLPPISLNCQLLLGVHLGIIILWPEVCGDWAAPRGWHCDSTLLSGTLDCKYSCWWSYLLYMAKCGCSRVSFII